MNEVAHCLSVVTRIENGYIEYFWNIEYKVIVDELCIIFRAHEIIRAFFISSHSQDYPEDIVEQLLLELIPLNFFEDVVSSARPEIKFSSGITQISRQSLIFCKEEGKTGVERKAAGQEAAWQKRYKDRKLRTYVSKNFIKEASCTTWLQKQ